MAKKPEPLHLKFDEQPVASSFVEAIQFGKYHAIPEEDQIEICAFGARGDGKTIAALSGMIAHAMEHSRNGFPLPVRWIGVRDTMTNHRLTTCQTLTKPLWNNCWKGFEQEHIWICLVGGQPLVELNLMGLEDQSAKEKLKVECVGVWFEEIAPSAQGGQTNSAGIDEESWMLAQSSKRLPSHAHPGVATTNLPDDDHWSWRHFVVNPPPRVCAIRFPPGERASAEFRQMLAEQYRDRPDLWKKLLDGEPGTTLLGEPVAQGFTWEKHVAAGRLTPTRGEDIVIGLDGGHTPTAVIGQQDNRGMARLFCSLSMANAGMKQLLEFQVQPWLARNAPFVLQESSRILIGYDPSLGSDDNSDIDKSSLVAIEEAFPDAQIEPGPIRWPQRREILLAVFGRTYGILLDKVGCEGLIKALNGRWIYPRSFAGGNRSDIPKKPNHPWEDYGDSLIYLLARLGINAFGAGKMPDYKVLTNLGAD